MHVMGRSVNSKRQKFLSFAIIFSQSEEFYVVSLKDSSLEVSEEDFD